MIVFDLACAGGHVFEAWFGSSDDYEAQRARGLVSCPICGDAGITKAVMAPNVSAKSNSRTSVAPHAKADAQPPSPKLLKAMMVQLAEAQRRVLEGSDYVGDRFAREARAIHLGEVEQRAIHGVATPIEARSLIEEGVSVAPLPFPVRPPHSDN